MENIFQKCYLCNQDCNKKIYDEKSFIIFLHNERFIHYCSYLCYKKHDSKIPKPRWPLIHNKEDFQEYRSLYPVLKKKEKKFEYLTLDEINRLTDNERQTYYEKKDKHMEIDSTIADIHEDIYYEDLNTKCLEDEYECLSTDEDY